jgi:hypothetical protein
MIAFPLNGGSHYSVSAVTGAVAAGAGANSEVFQFRWTSTTKLALICEIAVSGMRATTAFAAGAIDIKATVARAWTVDGAGGVDVKGGTGDSHVANNLQLRTNMPDSAAGSIRIATTAALTAGTKTLDTEDIGQIITHSSGGTAAATPIIGNIYLPTTELFQANLGAGLYPLTLATSEGFVIRVTTPATGVWNLGVTVRWSEMELARV